MDLGFSTIDPFAPCFAIGTMSDLYSFDDLVAIMQGENLKKKLKEALG